MKRSVIDNNDHASPSLATGFAQLLHETPERLAVELFRFPPVAEFAIAQSNSAEVSDSLSCWRMEHNRVPYFRGNPHSAARAVLLEVDLVQSPQIHRGVRRQGQEFFL